MRWIAPNQSIAFNRHSADDEYTSRPANTKPEQPRTVIPSPDEIVSRRLAEAETRVADVVEQLREVLGDTDRADLVLDGLTEYQWFARTHRQAVARVAKLTGRFFTTNQIAADVETQAAHVTQVLARLVSDSDRLHELADKIESTEPAARSFFATTYHGQILAERRAYLRAHVHRAHHRLTRLSQLTPRQRGLRHQLETFRPLDDFPNRPETPEACAELETLLNTLEPRFAELESEIAILPEPTAPLAAYAPDAAATTYPVPTAEAEPAAVTAAEVVSPPVRADAPVDEASHESTVEEVAPWDTPQPDVSSDTTASAGQWDETHVARASSEVDAPARTADEAASDELGWYEMQAGETCVDVLSGETMAPALPAFALVRPTDTRRLVNWVHEYLSQYEYVRSYVGFPVGDQQWWLPANEGTTISLDRLNDTIVYVAVQYKLIRPPQTVRAQLRAQFQPLEAQLPTAVSYVPHMVARRQASASVPLESLFAGVATWMRDRAGGARHETESSVPAHPHASSSTTPLGEICTQREAEAIRTHYSDNTLAYRSAFRTWVRRAFGRVTTDAAHTPAAVDTILRLTMREWDKLVEQPSERYRWLLRQHIRPSCWAVVQQVVQRWRAFSQTTGAVTEDTTVDMLARLTFANECCAVRTDDSFSTR